MLEVGPAGLRISAVAKKAGMAHPNIIHHFGSRQGLINALADRVGSQATKRITQAITDALAAPSEDRVSAMTHVLDMAYPGDAGKAAIWLHLSGAETDMKPNMDKIVALSHSLRQHINPDVVLDDTNRLTLLVTLALVGEVVSGASIKEALGFGHDQASRAHFRQWLTEILLNITNDQLNTSLKDSD